MAEQFGERLQTLDRKDMEAPLAVHQPRGGEDVEVGVKVEVVAEGLHGGDGGDLPVGQIEALSHPVAEAVGGGVEEMVEELAALAEDASQGLGHGEDELSVGHVEAEDAGDPVAGLADFALVAARAEVAGLAGEGEEPLVAAVGTLQPREPGGEVAAAVELADDGYGVEAERAVDGAVAAFVTGHEIAPGAVDDLPERRGAGTTGTVDGWHINCSKEQLM